MVPRREARVPVGVTGAFWSRTPRRKSTGSHGLTPCCPRTSAGHLGGTEGHQLGRSAEIQTVAGQGRRRGDALGEIGLAQDFRRLPARPDDSHLAGEGSDEDPAIGGHRRCVVTPGGILDPLRIPRAPRRAPPPTTPCDPTPRRSPTSPTAPRRRWLGRRDRPRHVARTERRERRSTRGGSPRGRISSAAGRRERFRPRWVHGTSASSRPLRERLRAVRRRGPGGGRKATRLWESWEVVGVATREKWHARLRLPSCPRCPSGWHLPGKLVTGYWPDCE